MSMNDYSVRGRSFRTGQDYQAALRDEKKIELIIKRYENADIAGKENIINVLNRGEVKFETLLGDDFLDELEEKHEEFLKNSEINDKDKKKSKPTGKKKAAKDKNSAKKDKNNKVVKKETKEKSNKGSKKIIIKLQR